MKKGLAMSMNVIIVIAIAVLTLVSLTAVFFSGSFGQISEAEAQRLFSTGCARYCQSNLYETFKNAYIASKNDQGFIKGCERLGHGDKDHVNRCFEKCSNCNLEVNEEDISRGYDNLLALTGRT